MVVVDLLSYQIVVTEGLIDHVGSLIGEHAPAHRYAIITDDHVGPLYAARVRASLGADRTSVYSMTAGEAAKTRETWATLTDAMLGDRLGRDTVVVALGGGVVGDLGGFVAATFMRGVPYVQIPTSLLAMIDASIGGKTGVDTRAGKNLVGAFHQPAVVIVDPGVLRTLPAAHRRAGLAEAIKHGVLADPAYFEEVAAIAPRVATGDDAVNLTSLVAGSVRIKTGVVSRDVREHGERKTLNFGHTLGHAIEAESDYTLLHGEAIAIGMVLEGRLAERIGVAEPGLTERIRAVVRASGLPSECPAAFTPAAVLARTRTDKKARGGNVEYALPSRIGTMAGGAHGWGTSVDDTDVLSVLGDSVGAT